MTLWTKVEFAAAVMCAAAVGGGGPLGVRQSSAAEPAVAPAAAPTPAAPAVTILDDNTYWRWIGVVKPTVVEAEADTAGRVDMEDKPVDPERLKKMDKEVPAKWAGVEFDDSLWPRTRGQYLRESAFYTRPCLGGRPHGGTSWGLYCLRAKFQVTDPAAVRDLQLSFKYRGGVVVYLNGQEAARASLPEGPLTASTPGASYPRDAYVDAKGGVSGPDRKENQAKRDRTVGPLALPAKLLRQGVNVLAVEVHRSDFAPGAPKFGTPQYNIGVFHDWHWSPSGMTELRLTAAGGGIAPNLNRPAGVQVWSQDINDHAGSLDFADPNEKDCVIRITGARNGVFSGKVVVSSDQAMGAIKAEIAELQSADGKARIPPSALRIRYAPTVHQEVLASMKAPAALGSEKGTAELVKSDVISWGYRCYLMHASAFGAGGFGPVSPWLEPLSEKAPARVELPNNQPGVGAGCEVWLSVNIPRDAAPGDYSGTMTVSIAAAKAADVPVHLHVSDWTLPDPTAFRTFVDILQSPLTLALQYKVPEWSEEHWKLVERSMALLGGLGTSMAELPIVDRTKMGNEDGMVTWIRKDDGTYDYDFAAVERYLKLVHKHLGTPKFVVLYVLWTRDSIGKGPCTEVTVPVLDRKTGNREHMTLSLDATPENKKLWEPLLIGLKERLAKEGMEKALCLGNTHGYTPKTSFAIFNAVFGDKTPWISFSHPGGGPSRGPAVYCYVHQLPDPQGPAVPVHQGRQCPVPLYRTTQIELRPLIGQRLFAAHSLFIKMPGLGHIGLDYWRIPGSPIERVWGRWLCDFIFPGLPDPPSLTWAGPEGAEPVAAYEAVREGIQEAEAMIVVSDGLFTNEAKLGPELAEHCRQALRDKLVFCTYNDRFVDRVSTRQDCPMNFSTAHYGWQELSQRFFTLAGEVAAKVGK